MPNARSPPAAIEAAWPAATAQKSWRRTPIGRAAGGRRRFVDAFVAKGAMRSRWNYLAMGRPSSQSPGEVRGFEERARHMIAIAEAALADIHPAAKRGFDRFIRREPLGTVFVIGAWNFPYLITVNAVVPAIIAGNTVILKQATQTLLCAERFAAACKEAGCPKACSSRCTWRSPTPSR